MASVQKINAVLRRVNKGIEHHVRRLPKQAHSKPQIDWFMIAGVIVMIATGVFILFVLRG